MKVSINRELNETVGRETLYVITYSENRSDIGRVFMRGPGK